jgi:DNA-binding transcriptional LysR family regulator
MNDLKSAFAEGPNFRASFALVSPGSLGILEKDVHQEDLHSERPVCAPVDRKSGRMRWPRAPSGTLSGSRLPFKIGVEAYGVELKLALVTKGLGLGLARPKILQASLFRKEVRVISVKDFRPRISTWVLHSPQVGRLSGPLASLRETLKRRLLSENLRASSRT